MSVLLACHGRRMANRLTTVTENAVGNIISVQLHSVCVCAISFDADHTKNKGGEKKMEEK